MTCTKHEQSTSPAFALLYVFAYFFLLFSGAAALLAAAVHLDQRLDASGDASSETNSNDSWNKDCLTFCTVMGFFAVTLLVIALQVSCRKQARHDNVCGPSFGHRRLPPIEADGDTTPGDLPCRSCAPTQMSPQDVTGSIADEIQMRFGQALDEQDASTAFGLSSDGARTEPPSYRTTDEGPPRSTSVSGPGGGDAA